MKRIIHLPTTVAALCLATTGCAADKNGAQSNTTAVVPWVNTGWQEEETVIEKALTIRAKKLEKATGVMFGEKWKATVSIEWSLGRNIDAEYRPESQTTYFVKRLTSELNVQYKTPVRLLAPDILADDDHFGELVDHELGHALSDIVSRRAGAGPFFSMKRFNSLTHAEQLGLNIVSEGIGMYFQRALHPKDENLSPEAFPETREEQGFYSYDMVAFQGGLWLVNDVLKKHGTRGLEWLVTHPFIANDNNVREAAIAYREKALAELARR